MLRNLVVVVVGVGLVATFASAGETHAQRTAYALVAICTGVGAVGNPLWRRRRGKPVTWANVFAGGWAFGIALPALFLALDGKAMVDVGFAIGSGVGIGVILAALLGGVYWLAYQQSRVCPHCAERIHRKACVCKHCHRDVEPLIPSPAA